jgi:uncharacterized protein involved in exopolysaccharide biosynthesis
MIALIVAWFLTRDLERVYSADTTIYTGMITGYNIEGGSGIVGGNAQTNIANLLYIITTDATIHEVSLRLFARCMMYGDHRRNNNYITAEHFNQLYRTVPTEVKNLINPNSEEDTYRKLKGYEKGYSTNYLFGILNGHPYFGIDNISSRLKASRVGSTDIIHIEYSANDPGICFNTLDILNKVFSQQYQELRYGETHNVIRFFEREVKKLHNILKDAEDDLIIYNTKKGIINYGEQTKQLTVLEMQQQNAVHQYEKNEMTTRALLDYLERQMGNRAEVIRANKDFTNLVLEISRLQSRIANLRLMNSENGGNDAEAQQELAKAQRKLEAATEEMKTLTGNIEANSYVPKTSIKASSLSQKWLDQILLLEQTKAERMAQDLMKQRLDAQYKVYSPIGATLDRKVRHISFIEGNYMEMMRSLNAARLRQKNLQMTTATLRVLNPPIFPLNAQPTNRLMYLLGAFMLTFILTALYFFVIEMLDRTLRDRIRSERITKIPVIGCYPRESTLRYRRFNKTISDMALRQLSKAILPYFKEGQQNVLNLFSTDAGNGKTYLAQELENYWVSIGLHVRRLTYDEDFLAEDSRYIMAKDIKDLCADIQPDEIAIVEYPNLDDNSVSTSLLNMGTLNLMVTRANRTWKDVDQKALTELQSRMKDPNTLFMYLTEASRYAVEEYVGQLPPYTKFNNFMYRISQLGLTATENSHAK